MPIEKSIKLCRYFNCDKTNLFKMNKKILLAFLLFLSLKSFSQPFTNVISSSGLDANRAQILDVLDYNNDSWEDVILLNGISSTPKLYRNIGGNFTDVTTLAGLSGINSVDESFSAFSFDYNSDGFQDIMFVKNEPSGFMRLFKNNCGNNFTEVTSELNIPQGINFITSSTTGDANIQISDYDEDSDLDLVFARVLNTNERRISVLINSGATLNTIDDIVTGFGSTVDPIIVMFDYDNNFNDDILVIRKTAENGTDQVDLYENNNVGGFSILPGTGLTNSSNVGFANLWDYNRDGFVDILLGTKDVLSPGPGNQKNKVFRNNGNGTFTDQTSLVSAFDAVNNNTVNYIGSYIFDLENDGDLDVLWQTRTSGPVTDASTPSLMRNNGSNVFTPRQTVVLPNLNYGGSALSKFAVFDYNNDGYPDIFRFGSANVANDAVLYKNNATGNNFISIKLLTCSGAADPRGARVKVTAGGISTTKFYGSNSLGSATTYGSEKLYFGLGTNTSIDSVVIYWPDGTITTETSIFPNQTAVITNDINCNLGNPLVVDLGPDTLTVCNTDRGNLSLVGPFDSYLWSTTETTPSIDVTKEGWYSVTAGILSTGCFANDSIYVVFGNADILQNDTQICVGNPVKLDASPRYDCNPFGAPVAIGTYTAGRPITGYDYLGEFSGHYYYMAKTNSTWSKAAQDALNAGGTLAIINSIEEQNFIQSLSTVKDNLWLGMLRDPINRQFRWMNCENVNFQNFGPGEPTDVTGEDYVFMKNSTCPDAGTWKQWVIDDNVNPDACLSNMYGLMELDVNASNIKYKWSSGETTSSITVTPTTTTSYLVDVTFGNATCSDVVSVIIPDLNNIFPSDTLKTCGGDSLFLFSIGGMKNYSWSNGETGESIFAKSNGWYKVDVISNGGCSGTDSVYLIIFNAAIRTPDTSLCWNTPFTLRGPSTTLSYSEYYSETFIGPAPFNGFSRNSNFTFNGSRVLGFFHNDSVFFDLKGLPSHDSLEISYDLYIHDTWEGDCSLTGKDEFRFRVDGDIHLDNTFSNNPGCTQSYPIAGSASKTGASQTGLSNRCFSDASASSTKYTITKRIGHTNADLNLSWIGSLNDTDLTACNESWSLENLSIKIRKTANILWFPNGETTQNIDIPGLTTSQDYWIQVDNGVDFCYDTVSVQVGPTLKVNFLNDTIYSCATSSVLISAPNGYDTYTWSTGDTTQRTRVSNATWYRSYVSLGGCYGVDSTFYAVTKAVVSQTTPYEVCLNQPTYININWKDNCNPFGSPENTGYVSGSPIAGYTWVGEYLGHNYYLADTRSNWSTAAQNALKAGGHLAIITDTAEQKFIQDITTKNVWLGLYRTPSGAFTWMNCNDTSYTNWYSAAPSANAGEDYVYMMNAACTEPYKWNTLIDDDNASTDPCFSEIYGLLEINEVKKNINWLPDNVGGDTLKFTPTSNVLYRAVVSNYDWPFSGGGCSKTISTVTVDPTTFNIERDSAVKWSCEGDTAILIAPTSTIFKNYAWSNGEVGSRIVVSQFKGWLYCTVDVGNCQAKDSVWVDLNTPMSFQFNTKDITCFGFNDGQTLAIPSGGEGTVKLTWLHDGSSDPNITNLAPGTYIITAVDDSGCVASDSILITNPPSKLDLSFRLLKPVSCVGDSNAIVEALPIGGDKPYTVSSWEFVTTSDTLTGAHKGWYPFSLVDIRGCLLRDSFFVEDAKPIDITAKVTKQILCDEDTNGVIELNVIGGTAPYFLLWNQKLLDSTIVTGLTGGNYVAYVVDTFLCFDSVEITIAGTALNKCDMFIPQGFTPNGDGYNDYFVIKGLSDFPDNELTIFNRWGEIVYQAEDYKNNWDGKATRSTLLSGGSDYLPNDTYYYVFVTKANNKSFSGYIYLTK